VRARLLNERKMKLSPTPITNIMPSNSKAAVTALRIAAILFALAAGVALFVAYDAHRVGEHWTIYLKQAVIYGSVCIVFFSVAGMRKRRAIQSSENTTSPESK
jgi:hypothetical protein